MIVSRDDAIAAIELAWSQICEECRGVLGSELHYQAMIYHALRVAGGVPAAQLGMNVKQWIPNVRSELFKKFDLAKDERYRGGFEPIPDIVVFSPDVAGDWRRRRREHTITCMLAVIEVKASERSGKRLTVSEVAGDIRKLAAHREETQFLGFDFHPVMIVVDTAPKAEERMTSAALAEARRASEQLAVEFRYLSQETIIVDRPPAKEI